MRFRQLLILAAAGLALVGPSKAMAKEGGDLTITRTFTGWRDAASFKRISEYFNGRENTGNETVLRTHPEQRSGYYFLVRLANPGAARPVQFRLRLIGAGGTAPAPLIFPAELGAGSTVFQLGLTGPTWQDPKTQPVAWQLEVAAADDGRILATEKSYLWEKPTGK